MSHVKSCTCPEHNGTTALPATSEFFGPNPKADDGLSDICVECALYAKAREKAELQRAVFKSVVANSRSGSPHVTDLTEEMMEQAGGITGVVARFWQDYNATPEGTNTRLNYHRQVFDLVKANTEGGFADKPVEQMSDMDLAKFLLIEGQRILPRLAGETVDAKTADSR